MISHNTLKNLFYKTCQKIDAPKEIIFYRTSPTYDGSAHVEIDRVGYHYVVTERGKELERKTTLDSEEVLYWLLSDVVFFMANKYELDHRIYNQDSRRVLFTKEVDLFKLLKSEWADKKQDEINSILKDYPYLDKN